MWRTQSTGRLITPMDLARVPATSRNHYSGPSRNALPDTPTPPQEAFRKRSPLQPAAMWHIVVIKCSRATSDMLIKMRSSCKGASTDQCGDATMG